MKLSDRLKPSLKMEEGVLARLLPFLGELPELAGAAESYPNSIQELIKRLQLSGGMNVESGQNYNVTSGGGRIGYQHPLSGNQSITSGLSGEFARGAVTAPGFEQPINDKRITGVDASYQTGPNTFGVEYSPEAKLLQLLFRRRF